MNSGLQLSTWRGAHTHTRLAQYIHEMYHYNLAIVLVVWGLATAAAAAAAAAATAAIAAIAGSWSTAEVSQ